MNSNPISSGDWYGSHYSSINVSADSSSTAFRILHKFLEVGFEKNNELRILEVGANVGEHVPFVKTPWRSYIATDIRMPANEIVENLKRNLVRFEIADVHNLPFPDGSFERVIVTCVFHHLQDPTKAITEIIRVTANDGVITILLPNDPSIAYRFTRALTTLRRARRANLLREVQLAHAVEHRNHFLSLKEIIMSQAKEYHPRFISFPFRFPFYNINLISKIIINKKS